MKRPHRSLGLASVLALVTGIWLALGAPVHALSLTWNNTTGAWDVGVTSNWLPFAHSILGSDAPGWGILMVAAGLTTWFTTLIFVVRFMPQRIGPTFFRFVNAAFSLILLAFATFCATVVSRHFLH